jgi:hypothetical protein
LTHPFELFWKTETLVSPSLPEKLTGIVLVEWEAEGLAIGSIGTAHVMSLIPTDGEPCEILGDGFFKSPGGPFGIGILDPKDEMSSLLACIEVIDQGCPSIANMDIPCGTGRKTDANWMGHLFFVPPDGCQVGSQSVVRGPFFSRTTSHRHGSMSVFPPWLAPSLP